MSRRAHVLGCRSRQRGAMLWVRVDGGVKGAVDAQPLLYQKMHAVETT